MKRIITYAAIIVLVFTLMSPMNRAYAEDVEPSEVETSKIEAFATQASESKPEQVIAAADITKKYGNKDFSIKASLTEGDGQVSYSSSDPDIAAINEKGTVSINGIGVTYITITASETENFSETSLRIKITVKDNLKGPDIKITRISGDQLKIDWNKNTTVDGYQIQYGTDSLFCSKKTKTIDNCEAVNTTISGLSEKKDYYVRIRSFKTVDGAAEYSVWRSSSNTSDTRYATASVVKKDGVTFEIRKAAGLPLYQYDSLQGSCTDGKYAYYVMYNRNVERCRIVKVRLSDKKAVKVSKVLNIAHGNDMTYNPDQGYIVVTHTNVNPKRLSIIAPKTLTIVKTFDVKIPSSLEGATTAQAKAIYGFAGIAYNAEKEQYVILLRKSHDFILLDSSFKPVKYVKASKHTDYTYQGIDATDDYILVAQSPCKSSHTYNIFDIYTWDGKYRSRVNVKKYYELESVYHIGSQFYAGFYRAYYKTYYKYETRKVKIKWKKVNGKWKYRYKTKKVKVAYNKLIRSNYVYKLDNL